MTRSVSAHLLSDPACRLRSILTVLTAVMVAGCANPFSPEASEAGVYKGAPDSLGAADEREQALRERLELIQKR